ncbi:LysE family translocator [Aestuariispira ectoiniformans]|uniref:LysE family translocator n=1 Tax=Aestuariispira ectoiniformans TaxID=2775080 RepID=UPI00223B6EB6|nr:LysE family translocator [Aestuariispira ectoiniformans]
MGGDVTLFLITVLSLIIVPGPDMLYVTSRSLADGRNAGIKAAIGISSGYLVFTLLVAVGLEAVFKAYPNVFFGFKLLGMAYLMYLAYRLFVADIQSFSSGGPDQIKVVNDVKYGFFTSVLNPKGLIFYFSLLPQFYIPGTMPFWLYALIFGTITSSLCFVVYSSVGIFASGSGHDFLMSHRNGNVICKIAGLIVFTIGVSLILSEF